MAPSSAVESRKPGVARDSAAVFRAPAVLQSRRRGRESAGATCRRVEDSKRGSGCAGAETGRGPGAVLCLVMSRAGPRRVIACPAGGPMRETLVWFALKRAYRMNDLLCC